MIKGRVEAALLKQLHSQSQGQVCTGIEWVAEFGLGCVNTKMCMFPASGNNVLSYYFMHRGMETIFYVFPSLPPLSVL